MHYEQFSSNTSLPAPCIVDTGIVVNKVDMQKLLADLGRVRYLHIQNGRLTAEGEGQVLEVFADLHQATLIANHGLYLNVCSFDCLELKRSVEQGVHYNLIQDTRQLQLIPLSNPLQEDHHSVEDAAALEAIVAQFLAANWDIQNDDEENFPC